MLIPDISRKMKLYSTKNHSEFVSLSEAVLKGLPDDNGLFMPESIPALSKKFIQNIENYSFSDWKVFDSANAEIYTSLSDTMKHLAYSFPYVGNFKVSLTVWYTDSLVNGQTELEVTTIAP